MVTKSGQSTSTNCKQPASKSLGYDFALLGLVASEARVDIIRQAARETAARIQQVASEDADEADQLLSSLASSTYRLLDPRRRKKSGERIQLSIVGETDFELQKSSRTPLISFAPMANSAQFNSLVPAELVSLASESDKRREKVRVGTIALSVLLLIASAGSALCMLAAN